MAVARLVVGTFVALLCAAAVMGAAPAQLATWLEKSAGLSGKRLAAAIELCNEEDINTVGEMREVHEKGRLESIGFKKVSLGRIEDALKGVPAPQSRRMQDQQQGSSCVDAQAEISQIWAQIGALLAHSQNAALPIGVIIMLGRHCGQLANRLGGLRRDLRHPRPARQVRARRGRRARREQHRRRAGGWGLRLCSVRVSLQFLCQI